MQIESGEIRRNVRDQVSSTRLGVEHEFRRTGHDQERGVNMDPLMRQAYACVRSITPIPADCGKLCDRQCCKGGDDAGMLMFPGEDPPEGMKVSGIEIYGYKTRFVVCRGWCERGKRPLSCRIFPFAPYLDSAGELLIIPDPRAKYICPLLTVDALTKIDPRFIAAVKNAFDILIQSDEIREMLVAYSAMLEGYARFTGDELTSYAGLMSE